MSYTAHETDRFRRAHDVLAREAGVVETALVEIESGQEDGTVESLRRIAAVLDVTLDDLAS